MASKVIETFIKMQLFKKGGAIASDRAVQFSSDALEKRIRNLGVDPNALNSQTELKQLLAYLKQTEDQAFNQLYGSVLSGDDAMKFLNKAFPKKGEVFDLQGNKLNPKKPIMGGTQGIETLLKKGDLTKGTVSKTSDKVKNREMFKDASERFSKAYDDLPPPGSRGGPDDIAAPFQSSEETIKNMIEAENKKNIAKIKNRKMVKDAIDNMSPTFVKGDRKYNTQMVAEDLADKKFGKEFYDLDQRQQMDIYDEALEGYDELTRGGMPDPEDFAQGGRAGHYTGGMVDVEPNLSDIGHGSDSLMARTRLVSPNNQATTSTGLNYLLAEDNDNIRVPFADAGDVYKRYQEYVTNMDKDLLKHFKYYKSLGGKMNMREYAPGFKREYADGGRIGFSGGGMGRRAFLKLMAALTGGVAMAKSGILSLGKKGGAQKVLPGITTPNAAGKPEWFDALVTRVIQEGDDVTKNFATKDREIVFKKKIDPETEILVTQDLDNKITRVDIDDAKRNVAGGDDPPTVSLQVTDEIIEEGGSRSKPVFEATENDYRNYATDPDGGYETEFVENTVQNTKDLTSDLTKVKSFATNKKETMKEFIQSKKRKDNVKYANENTASYAADRGPDYDPTDFIDDMADDMATGGRAGFNLGGSAKKFLERVFGKAGLKTIKSDDPDLYAGLSEVVDMYRNRDMEGLKKYLQKYLTHMDDEAIEDFIVGGTEATEGLSGELIRLGSGRDYKGKMEIFKKFDAMDDLENLEVTDEMIRKPNASGGIATMLGE